MFPLHRNQVLLLLLVTAVAALFALCTNHVWEDYYITYRSSKNLATGHGLVFNHGDRLHTFTSPLGVLLPAAASLLTLNHSDTAALWIFRLMSCLALGGAALLFAHVAQTKHYARLAVILVLGWLALDAKTVDFSINGMETAFLVLFLAYALWAHQMPGARQWRHLGAAWAGLMWTRPDSFIYVGLIAAGFWLFNEPERTGHTRRSLLGLFLRAGLLTTALYLPWVLFAWGYYGTPVPHTITAKSGVGGVRNLAGLFQTISWLPIRAWQGTGSMEGTFLPAYYIMGGWPEHLIQIARGLAAACSLLWVLPFLRTETRAASFAFFGAHAYLSYYPYFPFPWYLPSTTLLALWCLGGVLAQALAAAERWRAVDASTPRPNQVLGVSVVLVAVILAGNAWITWQSARLFAAQQRHIEDGTRRQIGEWLRARSRPGDAVFLEPLGYIGYFSGLKTYDIPGLSSREVVEARKQVGLRWAKIIALLQPRWLVLRPHEAQRIRDEDYDMLTAEYAPVQEFSVADELAALDVCGLPYLKHDARFTVYERQPEKGPLDLAGDTSPFPIRRATEEGVEVNLAHAPCTLVREVPPTARRATVRFGFVPSAYADGPERTDGAVFTIKVAVGRKVTSLGTRTLDPSGNPADRGMHSLSFDLPPRHERTRLFLDIDPGASMVRDWTYWSEVVFE